MIRRREGAGILIRRVKEQRSGLGGGVTDRLNELRFEGKLRAKVLPVINSMKPKI